MQLRMGRRAESSGGQGGSGMFVLCVQVSGWGGDGILDYPHIRGQPGWGTTCTLWPLADDNNDYSYDTTKPKNV